MNTKFYLIILTSFLLVFWIQTSDRYNTKENNKKMINKIKLPLLVSCLIGLILLVNDNIKSLATEVNFNVGGLIKELPTKNISPDIYTDQPNF